MYKYIRESKILGTDIYLSVFSEKFDSSEMDIDLRHYIDVLKEFENRFSRFKKESLLSQFNQSTQMRIDNEFKEILLLARKYYKQTEGVFNPCLLPVLLDEGYVKSKYENFVDAGFSIDANSFTTNFEELTIHGNTVKKPSNMMIDLGGIGKGYVVEKLAEKMSKKYENFCIELGGDMYLGGVDKENDYPYWAIEIENPFDAPIEMPTLLVKSLAIATSGINKRNWNKNGEIKNHLIASLSKKSVDNNIICVTVIADNAVDADVYAKTILILGEKAGAKFANDHNINAIFVLNSKKLVYTNNAEKYIYK